MIPPIQSLKNDTFLMHVTGDGLPDDRFAVQFFQSKADGDIVPVHPEGSTGKGKPRPSIMTLEKVRALRPGRDGIIIATYMDAASVATPPSFTFWQFDNSSSTSVYQASDLSGITMCRRPVWISAEQVQVGD